MRKLTFYSHLIVLMLVVLSCNQNSTDTKEDHEAIQALYKEYFSYAEAGDLDNFIELWDDNALRSEPGIQVILGKEKIKENFRPVFQSFDNKLTQYGMSKLEVHGDIAIGFMTITLESIPKEGGSASAVDVKALTIFKKQPEGNWKIYMDGVNFHPTWSMDTIPQDLMQEENPYY